MPSEEKIKAIVSKNINYTMKTYGIKNHKDFAQKIGIGEAQLSRIINMRQMPSTLSLLNICQTFHYSIDEFLFEDMAQKRKKSDIPVINAEKYTGFYQVYYCAACGYYKYQNKSLTDMLKSGIILVKKNNNGYQVTAWMDMEREMANSHFTEIEKYSQDGNAYNYMMTLEKSCEVYQGDLQLSKRHIYLILQEAKSSDRMMISLHRPGKMYGRYIGGMGILSMVSSERDEAVYTGYVGLASQSLLSVSSNIVKYLSRPFEISYDKLQEVVDELLAAYHRNLDKKYTYTEQRLSLTIQLNTIFQSMFEKNLRGAMEIPPSADDAWYQFIKMNAAQAAESYSLKNTEGK